MKKIFTYALLAMAVCLASCSQDETLEQVNNVTVPSGMIAFSASVPTDGLQTRAADANVQRFVMQVYDSNGSGVQNPDTDENYTLVSADGNFTLDPAVLGLADGTYTAVFWADYDAPDAAETVYNTSWLNWVTVNSGKTMTMAYQGKQEFTIGTTPTTTPMSVTLKRAVAQVNLSQNTDFTAENGDHIDVTYTTAEAFNVLTGTISDETISTSAYIALEAGEKTAGSTLGSFVIFAKPAEATLVSFTFSYNDVEVASIDGAPIQANYQTNISGDYSDPTKGSFTFNVTTDDGFDGDLTPGDDSGDGDETEDGDETGDGESDEPTDENQMPVLDTPTYIVNGYTISYSVDASDDKALKNYPTVDIYDENWTKIETLSQWPDIGENVTTATISGAITVTEPGTYNICITVNDLEGGYASVNIENIVITEQNDEATETTEPTV